MTEIVNRWRQLLYFWDLCIFRKLFKNTLIFVSEGALDWIINRAWQPGFVILSPFINELVSTAFTEIFNKDFENFPFERVFPNNKY